MWRLRGLRTRTERGEGVIQAELEASLARGRWEGPSHPGQEPAPDPGTHEVRAPGPNIVLSQAQGLHQGGAEPQGHKGPAAQREGVERPQGHHPLSVKVELGSRPALGSGIARPLPPHPLGPVPRLFSWQKTEEAK